jgi:hypothetical protein
MPRTHKKPPDRIVDVLGNTPHDDSDGGKSIAGVRMVGQRNWDGKSRRQIERSSNAAQKFPEGEIWCQRVAK